ncbi:MAG: GNAT family N-acetyltransferase [Variibacter sp.]
MTKGDPIAIRALNAAEAERRVGELADVLVDAVAHGASVNFLAGFSQDDASAFWRGQLTGIATGERHLVVADDGARLVGTVVLTFAPQPNAPHRAEIGKMLVHASMRRRGIGQRLLTAAEERAREHGRTLLILHTEADSDGERLYRRCGWIEVGTVPAYALTTDGRPAAATIFYKILSEPASAH